MVKNRVEAQLLPSRHHFALSRLIALLRMSRARPEEKMGTIFVIDRDQTAFEHYFVSVWIFATASIYFAAIFNGRLPAPVAIALAPFATAASIQVIIYVSGLLIAPLLHLLGLKVESVRVTSAIFIGCLAVSSWWMFTRRSGAAQWAASLFFAVLLVNAVAAVAMWLLRDVVARLEARCES